MRTSYNDDAAEAKSCPRCGETKTRGDFPRDQSRPDGRYSWCKPCNTANVRSRYDRETHMAWQRERVKDPAVKLRLREAKVKYTYGITLADVEAMRTGQQGRCAICGLPTETLFIDHCHDRGTVRGLLCHSCNVGVGMFKDDPDRMLTAAAYVLMSVDVVRAD